MMAHLIINDLDAVHTSSDLNICPAPVEDDM